MTIRQHLLPTGAAALLLLGGALRGATYEELSQQINKVAANQMELQHSARDRSERWARELASGKHDTPEMKTTRARIKQLQQELAEAQQLLQKQFEELPAFRDEAATAEREKVQVRQLNEQRLQLMHQRQELLDKNRPKPKAAQEE